MTDEKYSLLETIHYPDDLRKISRKDLPKVCEELRQFIIDQVSVNPGHLGSSLGVVELTVALHYVYNTPQDHLIWDVGHQAYPHKILTGRREVFHTNRKYGGISGFPKMAESEYDAFGVGHSSTSISAALGMAVASHLKGDDRKTVAVIGDGAMTGGLAFEGLNNAGVNKADILVILNDNQMAIDPNVGGITNYLTNIATSPTYNRLKDDVWNAMGRLSGLGPKARSMVGKAQHVLKNMLLHHSNLFEALNFRYFGPVDGHDIASLTHVLADLKNIPGPKVLHVLTKKGKGFPHAELNQTVFHAPGKFDKTTGERIQRNNDIVYPPLYQDVFGETIVDLAKLDERVVGITPAMPTGCSLNQMMELYPERSFDVGIAEQHAVTFSAGLAAQGMLPFCNIYSTFMQRAYDQIIHDVAIQNLPVVFCLDRGGLVGSDGPTHHGVFDLAFMRSIPNMTVAAPMTEPELRNLMYTAIHHPKGPFSIRYPRGNGITPDWRKKFELIPIGVGRKLKEGEDVAILSIGHVGNFVSEAIPKIEEKGYSVGHYDMRFLKPIDTAILHDVFTTFKNVVTVEDGVIQGGFGSAVIEYMVDHGFQAKVKRLGVPDRFVEQGRPEELYRECGLDSEGICNAVLNILKSGPC